MRERYVWLPWKEGGKKGCGGGVVVQNGGHCAIFQGVGAFLIKNEICDLRVFKREALSKRNRRFPHLFTLSCGVPTWTSGGGRRGGKERSCSEGGCGENANETREGRRRIRR